MLVDAMLRDELLAAIPSLHAFAISFTCNRDRADDLVQETILRTLANIDKFERGTNLNARLFTILRNLFHSEYRKRKYETEDADGAFAARLKTHPEQQSHLDFEDFREALAMIPRRPEGGVAVGRGTGPELRRSCCVQCSSRYRHKPREPCSVEVGLSSGPHR